MNDRKLKQLFETARSETPPVAPEDFAARVERAIRNEARAAPHSLWDELGELFPRLALTATVIVACCVLSDLYFSNASASSFSAEVNAISEQWLFAANGN
jgi:hypothetical protein